MSLAVIEATNPFFPFSFFSFVERTVHIVLTSKQV